jgi:tight adherence protein B
MTASSRRTFFAVLACIALSMIAVLAPAPAGAQTAAPAATGHQVQLVRVNSTDTSKVQVAFRYDGNASDVAGLKVQENNKDVKPSEPQSLTQAQVQQGVVFVVDTSASTDQNATLAESKNAINALVQKLPADMQIALVAAGSDAIVMQRFTTDHAAFGTALASLTPQGDGGMWEGVVRGASVVSDVPSMVGSMVLVTDGNAGTGTTFADAKGSVLQAGTTVYSFGVQSGKLGGEAHTLADETGGIYQETNKAADLTGFMTSVAPQLSGLYQFTYASANTKGVNDLTLTVADATTRGTYVVGSDAKGAAALEYQPPEESGGIAATFQNDFGKSLAIILCILAAVLGAYAILSIAVKDHTGLEGMLQPYSDTYVAQSSEDDDEGSSTEGMAQTAVMQRAVELTRQFAERRGFLTRVEGALERANLPLRAAEAMLFYVAGATVVSIATLVLTRNFFFFVIVLAIAALLPPAILSFLSNQRRRQFEALLPDTLQLLSGTLRAGYSMMQGVEAVSQEVSEPMGRELRRVVTEARLGRPLEESLEAVAERMDSKDFAWAVMAIRIQREVGGNLSELLMTVAETMTQRERLRRDVKSLTAEGRISAYVLAVLPVALGIAMFVINPDYMTVLFDENIGRIMLGGGLILMIGGFLWMQSIVKIDV